MDSFEEPIIIKKKETKRKSKKNSLAFFITVIMWLIALITIVIQKISLGTFLLIVVGVLNLPVIYKRLFKNKYKWLKYARIGIIFIVLMMTFVYTNYYGTWINADDGKSLKIGYKKLYINDTAYSYEKVDLPDIIRLVVKMDDEELVLHYSRDKKNMDVYLCEFSNNQCISYYIKQSKNIFYHYIEPHH